MANPAKMHELTNLCEKKDFNNYSKNEHLKCKVLSIYTLESFI